MNNSKPYIVGIENKDVFCFGSNLSGINGAGAALHARMYHGAKTGVGFGYMQETAYSSAQKAQVLTAHCFAIPTKDFSIQTLPLESIELYVAAFLNFAEANPTLRFKMTQIGCGLAGYEAADIAPMFAAYEASGNSNIVYDAAWAEFLPNQYTKFWGSA